MKPGTFSNLTWATVNLAVWSCVVAGELERIVDEMQHKISSKWNAHFKNFTIESTFVTVFRKYKICFQLAEGICMCTLTYDRFNSILIHSLVSTRAKQAEFPMDVYGTADTLFPYRCYISSEHFCFEQILWCLTMVEQWLQYFLQLGHLWGPCFQLCNLHHTFLLICDPWNL